jgi:sec-independent protein translocase protein TatA
MMGLDNPIHLLFLLVLLLLVFGAKRLPEMGRSLGSGMRGFKDSINGVSTHSDELPQPAPAVQAAASENQVPPVVAGVRERRP